MQIERIRGLMYKKKVDKIIDGSYWKPTADKLLGKEYVYIHIHLIYFYIPVLTYCTFKQFQFDACLLIMTALLIRIFAISCYKYMQIYMHWHFYPDFMVTTLRPLPYHYG